MALKENKRDNCIRRPAKTMYSNGPVSHVEYNKPNCYSVVWCFNLFVGVF